MSRFPAIAFVAIVGTLLLLIHPIVAEPEARILPIACHIGPSTATPAFTRLFTRFTCDVGSCHRKNELTIMFPDVQPAVTFQSIVVSLVNDDSLFFFQSALDVPDGAKQISVDLSSSPITVPKGEDLTITIKFFIKTCATPPTDGTPLTFAMDLLYKFLPSADEPDVEPSTVTIFSQKVPIGFDYGVHLQSYGNVDDTSFRTAIKHTSQSMMVESDTTPLTLEDEMLTIEYSTWDDMLLHDDASRDSILANIASISSLFTHSENGNDVDGLDDHHQTLSVGRTDPPVVSPWFTTILSFPQSPPPSIDTISLHANGLSFFTMTAEDVTDINCKFNGDYYPLQSADTSQITFQLNNALLLEHSLTIECSPGLFQIYDTPSSTTLISISTVIETTGDQKQVYTVNTPFIWLENTPNFMPVATYSPSTQLLQCSLVVDFHNNMFVSVDDSVSLRLYNGQFKPNSDIFFSSKRQQPEASPPLASHRLKPNEKNVIAPMKIGFPQTHSHEGSIYVIDYFFHITDDSAKHIDDLQCEFIIISHKSKYMHHDEVIPTTYHTFIQDHSYTGISKDGAEITLQSFTEKRTDKTKSTQTHLAKIHFERVNYPINSLVLSLPLRQYYFGGNLVDCTVNNTPIDPDNISFTPGSLSLTDLLADEYSILSLAESTTVHQYQQELRALIEQRLSGVPHADDLSDSTDDVESLDMADSDDDADSDSDSDIESEDSLDDNHLINLNDYLLTSFELTETDSIGDAVLNDERLMATRRHSITIQNLRIGALEPLTIECPSLHLTLSTKTIQEFNLFKGTPQVIQIQASNDDNTTDTYIFTSIITPFYTTGGYSFKLLVVISAITGVLLVILLFLIALRRFCKARQQEKTPLLDGQDDLLADDEAHGGFYVPVNN